MSASTSSASPGPAPVGFRSPRGGDVFDPSRTTGRGLVGQWRGFATAVRIGWATEANWTDPLLFFIYSVAKPVSSALILVVMLEVIGGATTREYRSFVVVGSALWAMVFSGIAGLAWSILEDRERYRMIKYVYVSPSAFLVVMTGRAVARVAVGAMGALITLLVGVLVLGVSFDPARVDWPLLVVVGVLGVVSIVAIGIALGAVVMQTRQEAWQYPEAVAGGLFLVSGAVFPLAVLPFAVQLVGLATPLAWWIEGTRRALFPDGLSSIGGPGSAWLELTGTMAPSAPQVVLALMATGAAGTLAALVAFTWSERRAKDRGLLDQTTGS